LVITPKEFNRSHGQSRPVLGYQGRSIPRSSLNSAWAVTDKTDQSEVLKLVRAYLGTEFDNWLSKFVVTLTQKDALVKSLVKEGVSKKQLQGLKIEELRKLADEKEIDYFSISIDPTPICTVVASELNRLGLFDEMTQTLTRLEESDDCFGPPAWRFQGDPEHIADFERFLAQQSLNYLHGQPYETQWNGRPLGGWFVQNAR
jgi:hypothetical protein